MSELISDRYKYRRGHSDLNLSKNIIAEKKEVERKIANGIYRFESKACFCDSNDSIKIAETDRYGFYYPLVLCKHCGLIRAEPRLTLESYVDFYDKHYRTIYSGDIQNKEEIFKTGIKQGKATYQFISEHLQLKDKSVVMEIGSNMGATLLAFHKRGHEVYGTDYGSENIEFGRKKTGIDSLLIGGIDRLVEVGKKADLVIAHHVLEHLLDMEKEIGEIRKIMKTDAYFYIAVPGTYWWIKNACKGNIKGLLQNAHTYQFSIETLKYIMECCGFELFRGNEEILSLFRVSDKYRNKGDVPIGESERALNYLKNMESKYLPRYYLIRLLDFIGIKTILKKIIYRS
jgi:SAM-dependent methyltransferase